MTKGTYEVAKLSAVKYIQNDDGTDEVLVTFRVVDDEYQKMVLQMARRDDIHFSIQGEKLYVEHTESEK